MDNNGTVGVFHVLKRNPAEDTCVEALDDLAAFDKGSDLYIVECSAIMLGYNHILGDINKPSR